MIDQMRIYFIMILCLTINYVEAQKIELSTDSDSAKYFYDQGWNEVMNNGNYSAAEKAFRNMYDQDSSFVLGQALLGRISNDDQERRELVLTIESNIDSANADERLVLELFLELISRRVDQGSLSMEELADLALKNLGTITTSFLQEDYYFAEYIEWINDRNGPKAALDSINKRATAAQHVMPFIIGYKVHLHLELRQFDHAQIYINQLENMQQVRGTAKISTVKAEYFIARGNNAKALKLIQDTERLDPNNMETHRLRDKMNTRSIKR